jgi:hypothetical protein
MFSPSSSWAFRCTDDFNLVEIGCSGAVAVVVVICIALHTENRKKNGTILDNKCGGMAFEIKILAHQDIVLVRSLAFWCCRRSDGSDM